jgi:transposase InsO family protein
VREKQIVCANGWIEDYNTRAPHSALGMQSPADYLAAATLSSSR